MSRPTLAAVPVVILLLLAGLSGLRTTADPAPSIDPRATFVPGEVLVRFKPETTIEARHEVRTGLAAVRRHAFRSGAEHWRLAPTDSVEEAVEILSADSAVLYAEPNYILTPDIVPLDPNFPEQWAPTA